MRNTFKIVLITIALGAQLRAVDPFVEFNTSMGAGDPAMSALYEECIRELKEQSDWFRFIGSFTGKAAWQICKQGYEVFKMHWGEDKRGPRIPKIIHQIWIGPRPFPEKYKAWQKTWQSLPGWTYKLWTDEEVESFPLINKELYLQEKNYGARADILRIEILYQEGGLYVDTDYECIKSEIFDELHELYDFYCGMSPLDGKAILINNALIGSIPGHSILKGYIDTLKLVDDTVQCSLEQPENLIIRGPAHFAQSVLTNAHEG